MKKGLAVLLTALLVMGSFAGCGKEDIQTVADSTPTIELESYENDCLTMEIPKGWKVTTTGVNYNYGIFLYDPEAPERQIFFYLAFSGYFSNQNMKDFLGGYTSQYGTGTPQEKAYSAMPVLSPATPEQVFKTFTQGVQSRVAGGMTGEYPVLNGFELIESEDKDYGLGNTQALWAKFDFDGTECEGQFMANVYGMDASAGMMGYATGSFYESNMVMGYTSASTDFCYIQETLMKSLTSIKIKESLVQNAINDMNATATAALQRGEMMSEAMDSYNSAWHERNKTYDVLSQKNSDATLGYTRLKDSETGDVYKVEDSFSEEYMKDPEKYSNPNLEPLADDDYEGWLTKTK